MTSDTELPPRLRRTLELVYSVDGVVGARVWQWSEGDDAKIAVAIRASTTSSPPEVLLRVQSAVDPMREPGESWEFGLMDHA